MAKMDTFNHYTIKSKHNAVQHRSDIAPHVIDMCKGMIKKSIKKNAFVDIPLNMPDMALSIKAERMVAGTLGLTVAFNSVSIANLIIVPTAAALEQLPIKIDMPTAPVVAVDWHSLVLVNTRPDVIAILGDLERCFAMAWFDK